MLADGQEVHYSSNRTQVFDFSWTMRGNHVLKIIAHATSPLNPSHNFRQYDFFVDGMSFFNMPKVHRLGLMGSAPVHDSGALVMAHSSRTGTYSNYNMGGSYYGAPRNDTVSPSSAKRSIIVEMEAPHNAQEEEAYLQEAIKASLSEANESQNNVPKAAPPQEQDLLIDFGSEPEPQSNVPALTAGTGSNMNYNAAIVTAPPSAASQYALGPSPGYGYPPAPSADPFAPAPYNAPAPSQYLGAQMTSSQAQFSNAPPAAQYSTTAFSAPAPAAPSFSQPPAAPAFASPAPTAPAPSFAQPPVAPAFSSPAPAAPAPSFAQPTGVPSISSQPGPAPGSPVPPTTFVPPPASPESSHSAIAPSGPAPVLTMAPQAKGLGADANAAYAKFASMDQFDLVKPKGSQRANPFDAEPASLVDNNATLGSLKSMQQGTEKKEVMKSQSMVVSQNQSGNWGGGIVPPAPQGYGMMGGMNQGAQQPSQYGMYGGYGQQQQQQPQYTGMGMQQQQPNYGQPYQQPMNQGMNQQQSQYGMPQQQYQYGMPQQQSQYGMPQQQF